jgi:hypothetical protein
MTRHRSLALSTLLLMLLAGPAFALEPLSDTQIRETIIRESVARYQATGHPCACPYNLARNGSQCGGRSAYSRPGGAQPLCYPKDASDAMVASWRRAHQ